MGGNQSDEIVTSGLGIISLALSVASPWIYCSLKECCTESWIAPNFTDLTLTFNSKLHGQHLVPEKVIRSIRGHLEDPNPSKALVLSFHGWTGSGKNFVSSLVVNYLYVKAFRSNYVRLFVPSVHFPHEHKLSEYEDWLKNEVESRVKLCPRSLFIFDEIEEMPDGLMDAIKPYIDFHEEVNGVDYRKAMFILLSNDSGNEITNAVIEKEAKGTERDSLELADLQNVTISSICNQKGGLKHSSVIHKSLITAFIPFLPMERKHVVLCIRDEINTRGHIYSEETVRKIIKELPWFPENTRKYSFTGCKWVADKVKQFYG